MSATTDTPTATTSNARIGFSDLESEVSLDSIPVEGSLPGWLTGSLIRTGPAKFDYPEQSLRHWFDGHAMLHRFAFADGRVSYANRFLETEARKAALETGKIAYAEFATDPCRSLFKRFATLFNPQLSDNANVNAVPFGDEWLAMTETPLPVAFDPETLETAGVAYAPPGELTTAHPHYDPGEKAALNFAVSLRHRQYRFFSQRGREQQRVIAKLKTTKSSYVHSFGITERYLTLIETPFKLNLLGLILSGRPYIENYKWNPDAPTVVHVFDRRTGEHVTQGEASACFNFHHANAFEDGDEVVVDFVRHPDPSIIDLLYLDKARAGTGFSATALHRYRVSAATGNVAEQELPGRDIELPRYNYSRCNGKPYRYVWAAGAPSDRPAAHLERIVKLDLETGDEINWSEDGCYPGEPVFAAEGRIEEDAGVILSVVLDARTERSFLLVLDAATLDERARAQVPHHIPFSFHGNYQAAR